MNKPLPDWTDSELEAEWLAAQRAMGDPVDDDQPKKAEARCLEIEAEWNRREADDKERRNQ